VQEQRDNLRNPQQRRQAATRQTPTTARGTAATAAAKPPQPPDQFHPWVLRQIHMLRSKTFFKSQEAIENTPIKELAQTILDTNQIAHQLYRSIQENRSRERAYAADVQELQESCYILEDICNEGMRQRLALFVDDEDFRTYDNDVLAHMVIDDESLSVQDSAFLADSPGYEEEKANEETDFGKAEGDQH